MPFDSLYRTHSGVLDKIRFTNGIDVLKVYFYNYLKLDRKSLIELLNDEYLHFGTLYMLQQEIITSGMLNNLSERNREALKIADLISAKSVAEVSELIHNKKQTLFQELKWILETGYSDDGLSNRYDEVLELTASLLIKYYDDASILPILAEMIFKRNKKGLLIHNLVWTFFEARNPQSLILIANHLNSSDRMDYSLVCKLLCFVPAVSQNKNKDKISLYRNIYLWLQENSMFLSYTGESFHQCRNPQTYSLCHEAKYLCKPVLKDRENTYRAFNNREKNIISRFSEQDLATRILLSQFSFLLYRRNIFQWNQWISFPIEDQIRIAKVRMEGQI